MADTYCLRRRTRSAGRAGPFGLGHPPGRKVVLGCLLFLVVPSASVGDIQVGLDLPAMCERADLVVVGRAVEVRPDGRATFADEGASYPGRLVVVTLDVERLLRGTAGRTLNFTFTVPAVPVIDVRTTLGPSGRCPRPFMTPTARCVITRSWALASSPDKTSGRLPSPTSIKTSRSL